MLTKKEGLAYAGLAWGVCGAVLCMRGWWRRAWPAWAGGVVATEAVGFPWWLLARALPTEQASNKAMCSVHEQLARLPEVVGRMALEYANAADWGLAWIGLALLVVLALWFRTGAGSATVVLAFLLGQGLLLAVLYVTYSGDPVWLMRTTLYRLLMHPFAAVVYAAAVLASTLLTRLRVAAPPSGQ